MNRFSRTRCILILWFVYFTNILAVTALFPIYEGGGWNFDWFEHYQISLFFSGASIDPNISPIARTPLYNLIQALFLLTNSSFITYQVVNAFLSSFFIVGFFLVAEDLFNFDRARWMSLFPLLSPWYLHLSWYPWPKMLCVFFVLMCLHYYLKAQKLPNHQSFLYATSIFGALGYLTHPLALFSLLGLALDFIFIRKPKSQLKHYILPLLLSLGMIIPWYLYTSFAYGIEGTVQASPMVSFQADQSRNWLPFFISRLHNAIFSIIPSHLFVMIGQLPQLWDHSYNPKDLYRNITEIYFNSIGGSLNPIVVF